MQNNHDQDYDDGDYTYQQEYYQQAPNPNQLDPAVERVRRKLMRLMIVSVAITILLVIAVFIAVLYKVTRSSDTPMPTPIVQNAVPTDVGTPQSANTPSSTAQGGDIVPVVPPATINREIDLPVGTRILSHSLSGDLISLETLAPSGGTELVIYNYKEGRVVARLPIPANDMPSPDMNNAN